MSLPEPYYSRDGITIFCGDCRSILPHLDPVDLVLTDPPYGLGEKWRGGGWKDGNCGRGRLWEASVAEWDGAPPGPEVLREVVGAAPLSIVWGGQYMSLPPQAGWLVWDKCADMDQAQAELAWSTLPLPVRVYHRSPLGVWGNGGANDECKQHPTQKPLSLMKWCLGFAPDAQTILDPFMGSGTTLVAARDLGRKCIGIEICEDYCRIAVNRLSQQLLPFGGED